MDKVRLFAVMQVLKIRHIVDEMVIFADVDENGYCRYKGIKPYQILNEVEYLIRSG